MKLADDKIARIRASMPLPNQDKIVLVEEPSMSQAGNGFSLYDANHTIYRVTYDYQIIWQIKSATPPQEGDDPFKDIRLVNENETSYIEAGRWHGFAFKLDITTGHAEMFAFRK